MLALALVASAALKLARPRETQAALATFGVEAPVARRRIWAILIAAELSLALGVGIGSAAAAYSAAVLIAGFGAVLLLALLGGRRGAPCGCFGTRSVVGWPAVLRSVVLSFAFAALPLLPGY